VFDSISKQGYKAAGFDEAAVLATATQMGAPQLVALGGVTAGNLVTVQRMGFVGAAVLGGVWASADPVAAVDELLRACEQLHMLEPGG
jgi:thiamine-phosphate pyrophosphorylase